MWLFWQSGGEDSDRRPAVHAASLMWASGVVGDEVIVQHLLHLVNGLEPGAPAFDTEVFVEEGAVEALDNAVGLWTLDPGGADLAPAS